MALCPSKCWLPPYKAGEPPRDFPVLLLLSLCNPVPKEVHEKAGGRRKALAEAGLPPLGSQPLPQEEGKDKYRDETEGDFKTQSGSHYKGNGQMYRQKPPLGKLLYPGPPVTERQVYNHGEKRDAYYREQTPIHILSF